MTACTYGQKFEHKVILISDQYVQVKHNGVCTLVIDM